ncbi:hypothetical protein D9Y95_RS13890 [Enterococcus hirae]
MPTDAGEGANKPTAIMGLFGVAYVPDKLSVSETLNDSGEQKLALSNENLGVQDKTCCNDQQ